MSTMNDSVSWLGKGLVGDFRFATVEYPRNVGWSGYNYHCKNEACRGVAPWHSLRGSPCMSRLLEASPAYTHSQQSTSQYPKITTLPLPPGKGPNTTHYCLPTSLKQTRSPSTYLGCLLALHLWCHLEWLPPCAAAVFGKLAKFPPTLLIRGSQPFSF